jgi:hypothetical protein
MRHLHAARPADPAQTGVGPRVDRAPQQIGPSHITCHARRQHLARHLHACGPRPVLEALAAVASGADLDHVLTVYARLPAEYYHALGADRFLPLVGIDGGRH